MGTRTIDPLPLIFDHAAQFFTVSDPEFAGMVNLWAKKGLIGEWQGTFGDLEAGGHFTPLPNSPPRYIGVNGMRPLADAILSEVVNVYLLCYSSMLLLLSKDKYFACCLSSCLFLEYVFCYNFEPNLTVDFPCYIFLKIFFIILFGKKSSSS